MSHRYGYSDKYQTEDLDESDDPRRLARRQILRRRRLAQSVVSWVVLSAFVVAIWALGSRGYFWPGWVIAGGAALLLLRGWRVHTYTPIAQADVDAEVQRQHLKRG